MDKQNIFQALIQYNSLIKENDELYRNTAKALGLTDSAFWILYTLREGNRPMTQSEICQNLYIPKQTVNTALKKLELDGYITLETANDRRSKALTLTEKGEQLTGRTIDLVIDMEQQALSELTDEERKAYLRIFRKYTDILKRHFSAFQEDNYDEQKNN